MEFAFMRSARPSTPDLFLRTLEDALAAPRVAFPGPSGEERADQGREEPRRGWVHILHWEGLAVILGTWITDSRWFKGSEWRSLEKHQDPWGEQGGWDPKAERPGSRWPQEAISVGCHRALQLAAP